ncbi:MAG: hypothetical protein JJ975_13595, partial [Bacteroidia bacterium]|nr:hypothetical protein [Bacteroidia bacterium]
AIVAQNVFNFNSSTGRDANWPTELFIDQGTGNFLLSGSITNDFTASVTTEHYVMAGDVATSGTLNVSRIHQYSNTDGLNYENNITIEPI